MSPADIKGQKPFKVPAKSLEETRMKSLRKASISAGAFTVGSLYCQQVSARQMRGTGDARTSRRDFEMVEPRKLIVNQETEA